jgi:hypothetical protein
MKEIWIIGIGLFGRHAVKNLAAKHPHTRLILVDPVQENLEQAKGPNRTLEVADGIDYTDHHLPSPERGPDWIVPALPVHLAAEWCLRRQGPRLRRSDFPKAIDSHIPNPMHGSDGNVYASHAAFQCPPHCSEPADLCSVTAEPRKPNMFDILGLLRLVPFESLVIRSHQLGPGIGGYRPAQLFSLKRRIEEIHGRILLSTACRCHGVITALRHD